MLGSTLILFLFSLNIIIKFELFKYEKPFKILPFNNSLCLHVNLYSILFNADTLQLTFFIMFTILIYMHFYLITLKTSISLTIKDFFPVKRSRLCPVVSSKQYSPF